ncbi:retrotransposon-related protein [Tanacetum coccineum]
MVECDASSAWVGAILFEAEHLVAYFSKEFSPSNQFKSAYDWEMLALVLAVQEWSHYLLGGHFLIRTDHYTLKFLLEQRITTTEQQQLLLKLMPYDFSISQRARKENRGQMHFLRNPIQGRMVIPDTPNLKLKLLQECHTSPTGGHGGFLKTLKRFSYLAWAEYSYNTGYPTSTSTTPFSVVYGLDPLSLLPYVMMERKNVELEQLLISRDDILKLHCFKLTKVHDCMRNQANSKHREVTFQVEDYAFLKIQPYRQKSLSKRCYEKLSPRFFGPYRVKRVIGSVTYELELPDDAKIHPVFHVSMLKPVHGSFSPDSIARLPITKDW